MRFKFFLLIIMCVSVISCEKSRDTKVLYLAHTLPQTHPVHKGILEFQRLLESKSNGKLKVKIFPDGQLGSERESLELLQIGSVAATKVSASILSNFVPEYNVLGIPYLFKDREHQFSVLEGPIGKSILEKGSKFWLRGLCYYDAGSRSFYTSTKAIRTPGDLKGLKIRVQNNQMAINMVNSMGGAATPMAYGELYAAIQQGVVDGAENNPPSFVSSNHYEISKYYTLDEHSSVPDVLLIGTKYWNKLSKEERVWVQEAADESAQAQKEYWRESVNESMKLIKERGVEVIIPEKSLFAEESKNVVVEFIKEFPEMAPLVNEIKNN
ncbi:C4-dicarboxylate ABC transporter substrate-binding protein [Polaribacter vadi]|jgi:tripartite ATP-independent transporter DctP family solute receptor|uniref:C4-dicarboxylate ABC transporter substrate-binding protein n=1 Tax=Polaribacter vadi TaxID=1774273 RepID=A0A1B8TSM0_9FLAO|nr:TRAP transporter substrate-binding protein [Polaribacter vadi]AOW17794.1 C4-dicarboxylate ABC transporter substrate-binding protein [Polaribacter vadi]OBY62519.1 C4-dicarboxylate ABC transporter substrate-binding protein [Polaribacter vadi]